MTTVVRPNRAVDRLAAVLVLAVGALLALALMGGLFVHGHRGSLLSVPFMILGIIWVTRTMRKAWDHLSRRPVSQLTRRARVFVRPDQ